MTFSRNSSLSSLSVDSADDEPSAEDQALLDSCISSAMPKSKTDPPVPRVPTPQVGFDGRYLVSEVYSVPLGFHQL